jgi:hypothetical protein
VIQKVMAKCSCEAQEDIVYCPHQGTIYSGQPEESEKMRRRLQAYMIGFVCCEVTIVDFQRPRPNDCAAQLQEKKRGGPRQQNAPDIAICGCWQMKYGDGLPTSLLAMRRGMLQTKFS